MNWKWIADLGTKAIIAIVAIALIATVLVIHSCQTAGVAKTETKLSNNLSNAAIESGADAVNVVGNRAAAEISTDKITQENDHAIHNAAGADAPVPPAVTDAGMRGLCQYAAYRRDPKCLRFTPAH